MNRLKLIYASSVAAIASIFFVTIITIAAEESAGLKNNLKALSGHHWTTKSILSLVVYFAVLIIVYSATMEPTQSHIRKNILLVAASALVGYLILLGFFLNHYF